MSQLATKVNTGELRYRLSRVSLMDRGPMEIVFSACHMENLRFVQLPAGGNGLSYHVCVRLRHHITDGK